MFKFFGADAKQSRLLKAAPEGPLKNFLGHNLPDKNQLLEDANLLAVDFETTGLDSNNDELLSIGFVQINNLEIDLSTAAHYLIKTNNDLVEETVVIHKITDDQISTGLALKDAVAHFLQALKGRVMVAHHAKIESGFTQQACRNIYGCGIIIPVIDTLAIEASRLPKEQHANNNLNLNMCCKRYNLPRYRLHDALSDALSCAELLLAQISHCSTAPRLNRFIGYLP